MPNPSNRRGFSLIELLVVVAIILILAAVSVPLVNKQLMSAHEAAAIQEIKAIQAAETQYISQFGSYASSLAALGPPANGSLGPAAAELIPMELANGRKSGYLFRVQATAEGYAVEAFPEAFNNTGRCTFYSDQTLVIRRNWGPDPATREGRPI